MPGASVTLRRIAAHRGVLAGCSVVLALVTLGLTALTSYLADAAVGGVRSTPSAGSLSDTLVCYTTGVASDEAGLMVGSRALLDKSFGKFPATVQRAVTSGAVALTVPGGRIRYGTIAEPGSRQFELAQLSRRHC